MKKYMLIPILLCIFFLSACNVNITNKTYTEKETRDIHYRAIWNQCLTDMAEDHPEFTDVEILETCKKRLQIALDNQFYENRNSDMFKPIPSDIYP